MRQDKDRISKWFVSQHGDSVLRLAGIDGFTKWKAVATETVAPRRLPDGLLEAAFPNRPDPMLVLVEFETYPASDVDPQVFDDILIVRMEKRVLPEVVCFVLKEKGHVPVTGRRTEASPAGFTRLEASWRVIRLWELDADDLLAQADAGLIPWAVLAHSAREPAELLAACKERIDGVTDALDRQSLLVSAHLLSRLAFPDLKTFNFFAGAPTVFTKVLLEVIKTPAGADIMEALKKAYFEEERAKPYREDILEVLAERFGSVPEDVSDRVNELTDRPLLKTLRKLAQAAPTLAEFVAELPPPDPDELFA